MKYSKLDSTESEASKNNSSDVLLNSFERDDSSRPFPDSRLEEDAEQSPVDPDRNVHEGIQSEGSSQQQEAATALAGDLEGQGAPRRLTTRQRIMLVVNRLVPIKETYDRLNNGITTGRMQSNVPGRFVGQGTDGVFRNLMAKPDTNSTRIDETNPPTYEEAAADATPEYWESSVIAPIYEDEVFVEGLPVGNIANFVWNVLVTVAFQFVGFLLCYLLHTSHAAKHGSRAGLGITFIFYGYNLVPANFGRADKIPIKYQPSDPNMFDIDKSTNIKGMIDTYSSGAPQPTAIEDQNRAPYFAYGIIAFGLFMILKASCDYFRVKQMERAILNPPNASSETANFDFHQAESGSVNSENASLGHEGPQDDDNDTANESAHT